MRAGVEPSIDGVLGAFDGGVETQLRGGRDGDRRAIGQVLRLALETVERHQFESRVCEQVVHPVGRRFRTARDGHRYRACPSVVSITDSARFVVIIRVRYRNYALRSWSTQSNTYK